MNGSRSSKRLLVLILSFLAGVLIVVPVQAQIGGAAPRRAAAHPVSVPVVSPSFTIADAGHVANGCSLRNFSRCQIRLRGIPHGSTIVKAWLYWGFTSTTGTASAKQSTIIFAGNTITGKLIGNGADACWCGMASTPPQSQTNAIYRAPVKSFVTGNGGYGVALVSGATPQTNGADPWQETKCPANASQALADGASLVVVYTNPGETGTTLVYDTPLAGNEFASTSGLSYGLGGVPAPGSGPSIFTEIGADGQVGGSTSTGLTTGMTEKNTFLNSTAIAGPGAQSVGGNNDSDWNGTNGAPLNQLWDTHSLDVTGVLATGTNIVLVLDTTDPINSDCLISVANVLTVR